MTVYCDEIHVESADEVELIDITKKIQKCVEKSGLKKGIVCIYVPGSTGSLTTIEFEPGLQRDFPEVLEKVAPKNQYYHHHETWHDDNGHSHVRASLMGPSITIPFQKKKIIHGTWQQIVFVELDTRPRTRSLIVHIIGE